MTVLTLVLAMVMVLWVGVLLAFAGPLVARWREPVLRQPVLIIESDDWGAGPLQQADALEQLAALLQRVRDTSGRPAVMTLGAVMEVPDGLRIAATHCTEYHALALTDDRFERVRAAMLNGVQAGVFVPQLHGQCHYWPAALMAAALEDVFVHQWLMSADPAATEDLPSPLQSRWVNASSLPSHALSPESIRQAVVAEAAAYQTFFGSVPEVSVPTTFVWNESVEEAWAQAGVRVIITPGHRSTCRNTMGKPGCVDSTMLAGEHSRSGQTYLVRDVYFEPALGHTAQSLVDGSLDRIRQGRACLVETHRFNFMQARDASLVTFEKGLNAVLAACPNIRFLSPLELAQAIESRDPDWIEIQLAPRLAAWSARLNEIPRFRRVSQITGLVLPLAWLGRAR